MPFDRPTLTALVERARSDLRGRLSLAGPLVRRAMADTLAASWAGGVHGLYGYLDWLSRQLFADKSDRDILLRQAALYGITPIPASFAAGPATATGTNGSVIPVDTILQISDVQYRVTVGQTISGGTATLPLEAVLAGSAGNLAAGVSLTFESPITGVNADAVVASPGIKDGFDQESTDGTRARLILRLQEPPEGGADQDYEAWALAVPGITRAWVYPVENGLGTVVVRFVLDGQESTIFPDGGTVAAVQAKLEAERPITAEVTAAAPTALTVDFTIAITPDTADVRAAVTAELADLLFRDAEPGDILTTRGRIRHSRMATAIGVAAGVDDYTLTLPAGDVVPTVGELAVMGVITWI